LRGVYLKKFVDGSAFLNATGMTASQISINVLYHQASTFLYCVVMIITI
jgi:hypothetical protein